MSPSNFSIRIILALYNNLEGASPSFVFGIIWKEPVLFFLKYLPVRPPYPGLFFVGRFLIIGSGYVIFIGLLRFSIIESH